VSTKSGCHDSIIEATALSFLFPLPKSPTTANVNLAAPTGAARNLPSASTPESATEHSFVILQYGARIDAGTGIDHVARLTRLTPGMHYTYTVAGPPCGTR
jgi:hypothetical protein